MPCGGVGLTFLIRHREKPPGDTATPGPPFGIDVNGNPNAHSLIPRGWQRSGGLAVLYDPVVGPVRGGVAVPDHLFSPAAGSEAKTVAHRTYQTILGVSGRCGILIDSPYPEGAEPTLVQTLLADYSGTVLICWEHHHIPALAAALPTNPATTIPPVWPDDRFDLIWSFTLSTTGGGTRYEFSQVPQLLLSGDSDQPIATT
jgi:hypothetical protein